MLTSSLLIALTVQVNAQPILDDLTPYSVAVRAFASKDEAQMHEIGKFMEDVFKQLDREYTKYGEPAFFRRKRPRSGSLANPFQNRNAKRFANCSLKGGMAPFPGASLFGGSDHVFPFGGRR